MEEILREILSKDKTLLSRRDDLIKMLDERVPNNLRRDYAAVKKALMLNIGELFAIGDLKREETKEKVQKILRESGMQVAKVETVVSIFVSALDWNKPKEKINVKKNNAVNLNKPKEKIDIQNDKIKPENDENLPSPIKSTEESTETSIMPEEEIVTVETEPIGTQLVVKEPVIIEPSEPSAPPVVREISTNNFSEIYEPNVPENKLETIFTSQGRLNRWRFFIMNLKLVVLIIIGSLISPLGIPLVIAGIIGNILIAIRRLHDLDKSGWFFLINLIPYINIVFSIYLLFAKGTNGTNKYGRDPLI